MRSLVACLSGSVESVVAAKIVQELGYKLGTGLFIHSGKSSDAENAALAAKHAAILGIPLREIFIAGLEVSELNCAQIACLAAQPYEAFALCGVILGLAYRGSGNAKRSEEIERWRAIQLRLTSVCSLLMQGPCNIHMPLLDLGDDIIASKAAIFDSQ